MDKEVRKVIQELYCKWCPHDCQLTEEDKLGCVASGGFVDEMLPYLELEMQREREEGKTGRKAFLALPIEERRRLLSEQLMLMDEQSMEAIRDLHKLD